MSDEPRTINANGVRVTQSMIFFALSEVPWLREAGDRLDVAEDVFGDVEQMNPNTVFGFPFQVDPTMPPGEIRFVDKNGVVVGRIFNIGNPET